MKNRLHILRARILILVFVFLYTGHAYGWGFYAHQRINYGAVFLLPPELIRFYKPQIGYLSAHAVDPDMRRYAVAAEGARHYLDIDHYGSYPYPELPRGWNDAVAKYTADTLNAHGIVPWWIQTMLRRLTEAFRTKDGARVLKLSAEIGHYIADAHVPLHASSNHNGQFTGQKGIHGFWESRIPELLAESDWDFIIGRAKYLSDPSDFIWARVLESAAAADTVLRKERELSLSVAPDRQYSFELRNGKLVRQYASSYALAYDKVLDGMVERRMRASIYAIACFWLTAWADAGQPLLDPVAGDPLSEPEQKELAKLQELWRREERDH